MRVTAPAGLPGRRARAGVTIKIASPSLRIVVDSTALNPDQIGILSLPPQGPHTKGIAMKNSQLDWNTFVKSVLRDDKSAAQAHLRAGRPIYYRKQDTPADLVIRESPDGKRELIEVTSTGAELVVSILR